MDIIIDYMLSCLTYNIQFGKKLPEILEWVNSLTSIVDILCFQEFPDKSINSFLSCILYKNYSYEFNHCTHKRGCHHGQLTLYNKTKLKVIKNTTVKFGKTLYERLTLPEFEGRTAAINIFSYKTKQFALVNAHLVALRFNSQRRKQIKKIMDLLKEHKNITPQVFLGDLNYTSLLKQKKLIDFMEDYGFKNGYKLKTHKLLFLHQQLDYVFYKNCEIINPEVIRVKFSDHYPVRFGLIFDI